MSAHAFHRIILFGVSRLSRHCRERAARRAKAAERRLASKDAPKPDADKLVPADPKANRLQVTSSRSAGDGDKPTVSIHERMLMKKVRDRAPAIVKSSGAALAPAALLASKGLFSFASPKKSDADSKKSDADSTKSTVTAAAAGPKKSAAAAARPEIVFDSDSDDADPAAADDSKRKRRETTPNQPTTNTSPPKRRRREQRARIVAPMETDDDDDYCVLTYKFRGAKMQEVLAMLSK